MIDSSNQQYLIDICTRPEGCTDSDIEEYCFEENIDTGEAFHFIHEYFAPEGCKGCKYVDFLCGMYPCNDCVRIAKDHYTH